MLVEIWYSTCEGMSLVRSGDGWIPFFNFELIFRILIHTLAVFHVPRQGFIAIMSVLCQAPIFYFFYRRAKIRA